MSETPDREMDLGEYLARLPLGHLARRQFGELTERLSSEKNKVLELKNKAEKVKEAVTNARRYLDSFIETEGSKDHYIESTGEYENCQVDFNEAQKALDFLGCDDDHGIDTSF